VATKMAGETAPKRKRAPRKQVASAPVEATGKAEANAKAEVKRVTRMSDGHKAALAAGREEGRAVRNYLEVIGRPKRPGRKRTVESITRQVADVDAKLANADAGQRLLLIQQRFDLKSELEQLKRESSEDLGALEAAFVKVAAAYSERKGISYAAWREAGVSANVLRQASISRSQR
jgi:hypothetical protein